MSKGKGSGSSGAAKQLGSKGGKKGGPGRARKLSSKQRSDIARKGAEAKKKKGN